MSVVVQSAVLAARALREIPRLPNRIIFPLLIPIMQLVLFAAVFEKVVQLPGFGAESSLDFLAPGMVAFALAIASGGAGFQMVRDIEAGFFDKLRVAPISRMSIVIGLLATDAVRLALQSLAVFLVAVALGADHATGVAGALVIMTLGGVFGAAWSGISLNVALRTRNAEVTAASNVLVFPLWFGSTALMPENLLPSWLQAANNYNPVTSVVEAMRALMLRGWEPAPILEGFAAAGVVAAVTLPLAVLAFRRTASE